MKQCIKCGESKPLSDYRKSGHTVDGYHTYCGDCAMEYDREYNSKNRMYVNGKHIPKDHPLWKPGRFKSLDDAWSHQEIERTTAGEVYIIRNPAFCNWLKVGKAVNSEDRLQGYQTSSPFRDYVLEYCEHFENRHQAEATIHRMLEKHPKCFDRKGEWFKTYIPTIKEVMNEYRNQETGTGHRDESCPQHDLDLCNTGC